MYRRAIVSGVVVVGLLGGCAGMERPGAGTAIGGLGGAAGGALLGAAASRGNPYAMAAGGLLGGLAGLAAGTMLDRQAQAAQTRAMQRAYGQRAAVPWQTAQAHGTVTPGELVLREDGTKCQRASVTTVHQGKVYSNDVCLKPGVRPGEVTVEAWEDGR